MATEQIHMTLGPLDHIAPWNIPQSIIYLSVKQGVQAHDVFCHLRESLRRTLLQVPWLSGQIQFQQEGTPGWRPGQLEIRYQSLSTPLPHQLRFNVLKTEKTYGDLRDSGFPLDAFKEDKLLPVTPFRPDFQVGADVLVAQANFLPGGCLLVLSICPPASDGTAMLMVTRVWADHCNDLMRQAQQKNSAAKLSDPILHELASASVSRYILDGLRAKKREGNSSRQLDLERWQLVGVDPVFDQSHGDVVHNSTPDADATDEIQMRHALFYLPHAAYGELCKECVTEFGITAIHGNDLICAFIWRSVIRAWASAETGPKDSRGCVPSIMSELAVPFDARPDLMESAPTAYLGNLNFENRLSLPLDFVVATDTTIPQLAKEIRTRTTRHGHRDALLDAYTLLQSVSSYKDIPQLRAARATGTSVGILSPMVLPFNEACFGALFGNDGRPDAFRPLMGNCNRGYRICFVIPRKKHGGVEFVLTLSTEEMDFLCRDREFGRYAFPLA